MFAVCTSSTTTIRPLTRDDGAAVDAVFEGMSPRSRYLRFHAATPRLTVSTRRALLDVDGADHWGLVAEVTGPSGPGAVGIGRILRIGDRVGELAVAVVDRWQGCGVGRLLLEELRGGVERTDYEELRAYVVPDNRAIVSLLRSVFPGARSTWEDGIHRLDCPLRTGALATADRRLCLT